MTAADHPISINGVRCRQWKYTSDGSFPATYWNCVDPDSPIAFDEVPASTGQAIPNTATRSLLLSGKAKLFVHANFTNHNAFFLDVATAQAPGFTFRNPDQMGKPIHVSVMQTCVNCAGHLGPYTFTTAEMEELAAHEIGHAVDMSMGVPPESAGAAYKNYHQNDLLNLDFSTVGATQATSTQRAPCSTTNTAPFDAVSAYFDPSQPAIAICIGGALNPTLPFTSSDLNSTILQAVSGRTGTASELYAQTFAYVTTADATNYLDPAADGVFANSANGTPNPWFSCTLGRATQLATGSGSIPAGCTTAVPSWYPPLIGQ